MIKKEYKIKRENHKGKYYSVVRDLRQKKKGRILTRRKWSHKNNIKKVSEYYAKNYTLYKDIKRIKTSETANYKIYNQPLGNKKRFKKTKFKQIVQTVEVRYNGENIKITSASSKFYNFKNIIKAKAEAETNLKKAISNYFGNNISDESEGGNIFNELKILKNRKIIRTYVTI